MSARLTLISSVGESMIHVVEPIAEQVTQFIVNKLGYHDLIGDNIELTSEFRKTSQHLDANHNAKLRLNRVRAKLNPTFNPASIKWEGSGTTIDLGNGNTLITGNHTNKPGWEPSMSNKRFSIFHDEDTYVDLIEHLVGSSFMLEIQMDLRYQTDATECLSRIYHCFANGDKMGLTDVMFDYPVPMNIQRVLRKIHDLSADTGSCLEWVKKGSLGGINLLVNRNKPEVSEVVINKNNFNVMYLIDCSQEFPEPIDQDGARITFSVAVQFARPDRLLLEYPIIVNNNFLPSEYVPMEKNERVKGITPIMWSNPSLTALWEATYKKTGVEPPVQYPWWDPWDVPGTSIISMESHRVLGIFAFTLDDVTNANGVTILDLYQLPGATMDTTLKNWLIANTTSPFSANAKFCLTVFCDDYAAESTLLELTSGRYLKIKCRRTTSIYRLVISQGNKVIDNKHAYEGAGDLAKSRWDSNGSLTGGGKIGDL